MLTESDLFIMRLNDILDDPDPEMNKPKETTPRVLSPDSEFVFNYMRPREKAAFKSPYKYLCQHEESSEVQVFESCRGAAEEFGVPQKSIRLWVRTGYRKKYFWWCIESDDFDEEMPLNLQIRKKTLEKEKLQRIQESHARKSRVSATPVEDEALVQELLNRRKMTLEEWRQYGSFNEMARPERRKRGLSEPEDSFRTKRIYTYDPSTLMKTFAKSKETGEITEFASRYEAEKILRIAVTSIGSAISKKRTIRGYFFANTRAEVEAWVFTTSKPNKGGHQEPRPIWIKNLTTGEVKHFESFTQAAKYCGVAPNLIASRFRENRRIKNTPLRGWAFSEDYQDFMEPLQPNATN